MTTRRTPGPWIVLVALLVGATFSVPTYATVGPMEIVYTQDFENGYAGWTHEGSSRTDRVVIDDQLPFDIQTAATALVDPNHALHGCSMSPNCGFRAESPSLASMGVDTDKPYAIDFRYGIPETPACWTYTLASKHATIVVLECHPDLGYAVLGFVDELSGKDPQVIGNIALEQWNDISVIVDPYPTHAGASVSIRINGVYMGTFERETELTFDGLVFMDLPFRYVDATEEDTMPYPTALGSGAWDDVTVRREIEETGPPPRGVKPHCEPNPFNPRTVVSFELDREASVRIDLYDVSGRLVRSLFDGRLPAGPQALPWDGRDDARADVASGVYLVRTVVDGVTTVTRATVVR